MMDTGLLLSLAFRDKDFIDNKLYKSILLDKLGINEGMLMKYCCSVADNNKHNLFIMPKMIKKTEKII